MSTLSLKNINKIYANNVQAVFDFNLEIKDKEFIVLVGPSGCGKSTTLRMIAGLEDITYGELYIDGQIMNQVEPKDRHIAMVFQNYALYPHMTVYKNMAFALKLRKRNMPIFEKSEDVDNIVREIDGVYKQIKKIDSKYKKDQNNNELLKEHVSLYQKVYQLIDKLNETRKPIYGINQLRIKEFEKKIAVLKKEINRFQKQISVRKQFADGELEAMNEGISQREELIEQYNNQIEEFKTKETILETYRHLTKREIDIEINKVADSIDLTRYLFRKPSALSGGQRQRVALGRAIVRKPKVFLMDEPLSNLDAKLRVQTRSEISKLHKRVGATTIYVTHDQTEAMTMADRIVIMKDGYIQQVGTPDEVYNDPANKFVGGFIGSPSMNFINGHIEKGEFVIDGTNISVTTNKKNSAMLKEYEGKDIILGVRPEDMYKENDKNNENPSNSFEVNVTFTELLGSELIVYASAGEQNFVFKTKATENVELNENIKINFNLDKMYYFDKDTEKRIK